MNSFPICEYLTDEWIEVKYENSKENHKEMQCNGQNVDYSTKFTEIDLRLLHHFSNALILFEVQSNTCYTIFLVIQRLLLNFCFICAKVTVVYFDRIESNASHLQKYNSFQVLRDSCENILIEWPVLFTVN